MFLQDFFFSEIVRIIHTVCEGTACIVAASHECFSIFILLSSHLYKTDYMFVPVLVFAHCISLVHWFSSRNIISLKQ